MGFSNTWKHVRHFVAHTRDTRTDRVGPAGQVAGTGPVAGTGQLARYGAIRRLALIVAAALAVTITTVVPAHAAATGSIGGVITDGGAPVPGATIEISSDDGRFWRSVQTDSAGRYEMVNVPEAVSAYRVMIDAPGHPTQYAYGKTEWSQASLFSVTAGQRTTVDDTLLPTGTITGRFTDTAGNGVPAWVYAFDGTGTNSASGYSDADGHFSFRALPATYRIRFSFDNAYQYAYGTLSYAQAATFQVTVGATVTVNDVKLDPGAIQGRVTNADGSPAAEVTVEAHGNGASGLTTSDANGAYRLDGLAPGAYTLSYQLPSGAMQWAHQTQNRDAAQTFTVASNAVTTVDEQLLPIGSVEGRFTDSSGAPMPDVTVYVSTEGSEFPASTSTDADGRYRIDGLFAGTYTVQFSDWRTGLRQYAYGKLSVDAADPVTIHGGQVTTVNDSRLAMGGVRLTARDSVTGARIDSFSASILDNWDSTENGTLDVSEVPVGTHTVEVYAEGYVWGRKAVTVLADQLTEVELTLWPVAKITTTVTDRATGAPVAGICVLAVSGPAFGFPDGCAARSDTNGAVTIEVSSLGKHQLFVLPDRGSPYGAQWVGRAHGTGTQSKAESVTVSAGQTVAAPQIKLDRPGIIAGKATSGTGAPLRDGLVGIVGPDLGAGTDRRYSPVQADGVYVIDWLGPYRWPLLFQAQDHAYQWSGAVGNRLEAELVTVKKRKETTYDYRLKQGTALTVTGPAGTGACRVAVFNAVTGDPMGVRDTDSLPAGANLPVIGPQDVKVQAICQSEVIWHGGTDFASATTVRIPASGSAHLAIVSG